MGHLKGFVLIAIAAVLAASAAGLVYYSLRGHVPAAGEATDTVPVVVAAEDITYGTKLTADGLRVAQFPAASVPASSYTVIDSVVGHTTKVFLVKGEPVLAPKLSTVGGGLSVRIPESQRASSVNVNDVTGVSGFILPGDRVDVLVTVQNLGKMGNAVTKTILQNTEVLAAGVQTTTKNNKPVDVQCVTLLVDPKGAEDLALGLNQGKIHLVLRNPADHQLVRVEPTNTDLVMGRQETAAVRAPAAPKPVKAVQVVAAPPPPPPPPPEKKTYTIIRDGKIGEEKYPAEKPAGS